ncbi:hypothetical protein FOL47_004419, partial [Perkinsus chesapeaki]
PHTDVAGLCDSLIARKKSADSTGEIIHIKCSEVCSDAGLADDDGQDADLKISEAMAAAVEAQEAKHTAWVISGFPSTRAQARLMLTKWAVVPDRVLILRKDDGDVSDGENDEASRLYHESITAVKEVL